MNLLTWPELAVHEKQQGGYWLYPCADIHATDKIFIRVPRPEPCTCRWPYHHPATSCPICQPAAATPPVPGDQRPAPSTAPGTTNHIPVHAPETPRPDQTAPALGYHWSPSTRRRSIERYGLRIGQPPVVNGIEDDFRAPWISVSASPLQAWWLSAGALQIGGFTDPAHPGHWDLYEMDLTDLATQTTTDHHREIRVLVDVPPDRLEWVGKRAFTESIKIGCADPHR